MTLPRKTKIVLASLLKPVDDTRMYEKFALSLAGTGKYQISVVGFYSESKPQHPDIQFFPIFKFARLNFRRFLSPLKYSILLIKLKPDVLIVNSPDFQLVTVIFKILFGSKILYDIQENYYLNIRHAPTFPGPARSIIAAFVRSVEKICAPQFDHFILAEKVYAKQLSFVKTRFTVIENKYKPIIQPPEPKTVKFTHGQPLKLLYTGTIAEHYGIFEAIELADRLQKIYPSLSLTVTGKAAQEAIKRKLLQISSQRPHLKLQISSEPIPHAEIIKAIQEADIGIASYRNNKSVYGRMPTKIYEYIAHLLPFFTPKAASFNPYCRSFNACVPIDFHQIEPEKILDTLFNTDFYGKDTPVSDVFWTPSEETKLTNLINGI